MTNKILIFFLLLLSIGLFSCNRYIDQRTTSTTPTIPTTPTTPPATPPPGGGTTAPGTGNAAIKFYNVVDFGNLTVSLNDVSAGTVAQYYPTTYTTANAGTNNIKIYTTASTATPALNIGVDLAAGKYYSCFMYKVGYDWKISLVSDDLTAPPANKANVRVLDFRTQAYFDYVNVRITSPGLDQLDYTKRNFLDHATYDTYTRFKSIYAGSYNVIVYNDSTNLAIKKGINFDNGKIYSVILMTPASASAQAALYSIIPDIEKHN